LKAVQAGSKTVGGWEHETQGTNSKSVFLKPSTVRIEAFEAVGDVQRTYKVGKFNRWINTRRSEQKFTLKIEKTFGSPKDVVIAVGDWEQKQHRKCREWRKGKGMHEVMRRAGYQVLLVDEFRTTAACL